MAAHGPESDQFWEVVLAGGNAGVGKGVIASGSMLVSPDDLLRALGGVPGDEGASADSKSLSMEDARKLIRSLRDAPLDGDDKNRGKEAVGEGDVVARRTVVVAALQTRAGPAREFERRARDAVRAGLKDRSKEERRLWVRWERQLGAEGDGTSERERSESEGDDSASSRGSRRSSGSHVSDASGARSKGNRNRTGDGGEGVNAGSATWWDGTAPASRVVVALEREGYRHE